MSTGITTTGPEPALPRPARVSVDAAYDRRWWTLAVLCLSLLIVFVGNSSLNVALPTLSRELHATTSQLQWVVAAYSLVFAGLLFSTGALGDRFGRKGALQLGLVGFLAGAALASASTEMWQLISCRAVMGASAALIMPSTLSILVNVFPAQERAKAIAIWAATTGAAGAIGPVASGLLLGHFWYGAVFLVNVPIIAFALIAGWFLVPKSRDPEQGRLDPLGAGLSVVGISALVYGLIQAPDQGWGSSGTLGVFAVALVVLTAFVAWELRVDEPMLDMHFFRNSAFSTGTGGMILVFLAMFGVMFLITQYFQLVLDYSPLSSALRMLPMAPIMIIVAPLTPRLSRSFGAHRVVAFGMVLVTIGLLMFRGARSAHAVCVRAGLVHPAGRRNRVDDVADDRRNHGGGSGPSRRRRFGDERRHPRARRRVGSRRAGERRGVALRERRRQPGPRIAGRGPLRRGRRRWRGPWRRPPTCPRRRLGR